jgi:hypothetical protein
LNSKKPLQHFSRMLCYGGIKPQECYAMVE